jgi:ATP-dependent Clp protease protease subunit
MALNMENVTENFSYEYYDRFLIEDIEDRRIFINSEIDETVVDLALHHIIEFNRQDKDVPIEKRKPIRVYINSPGGTVSDGFGFIDSIINSKTPVYTINLAQAASMAFLIFIAGHKRYTMPHAEFLMHDGSTGSFGSSSKVKDRIEFESIQLEGMTKQYVISRTNIDDDLYENKRRVEWYFLADEAKAIGAVDVIVGKDCDIDEIL